MRTKRKTERKNTRKTNRKTHKKPNLESQKKLVLKMLRELKWPKTARPNVLRKRSVMAGYRL